MKAIDVNSKETLRMFLMDNRIKASMGLVDEIDFVGVDKEFKITIIKYKEKL